MSFLNRRNIAQLTKVKIMKKTGEWETLSIPRRWVLRKFICRKSMSIYAAFLYELCFSDIFQSFTNMCQCAALDPLSVSTCLVFRADSTPGENHAGRSIEMLVLVSLSFIVYPQPLWSCHYQQDPNFQLISIYFPIEDGIHSSICGWSPDWDRRFQRCLAWISSARTKWSRNSPWTGIRTSVSQRYPLCSM